MIKKLTLCIVYNHPKILLGMKKRGFGVGRGKGFGGKVESGEAVEDAAKREIWEEAAVRVVNVEKVGHIDFEFKGDPQILEVNIFKADKFEGKPTESEEMKPQWFHVDEIPFDVMWPDDRHWVPLFLAGKRFKGRFLFGKDDAILAKHLAEVEIAQEAV